MKIRVLTFGMSALALAAGLAAAPLSAQPAKPAETNARERVTVHAPYVIRRKQVKRAIGGNAAPLELISIERPVYFGDLDLSKPADATTLENRVSQAAQEACKELEKRFPKSVYIPTPDNQDCAGNAVKEAMVTVKQLEISASAN